MSAKEGSVRRKGKQGEEDGKPDLRKRNGGIPEEPAEEDPEKESVQADEAVETVLEEPEEAPARTSEPIAVLAEANGAGVLAVQAAVGQNGHPPEPEKEVPPEPSEAPKPQLRVFCHLKVELGLDAIHCFTKNGVQTKMVKGAILLADEMGCRVRVVEARFIPERPTFCGSDAKKFKGGFKRP